MLTNLQQISEQEMLNNWALAEVTSPRRQEELRNNIPHDTKKKLDNNQSSLLSVKDFTALRYMILASRMHLLIGLMRLNLQWYKGELSIDNIDQLRIMNWDPFVELAGSRNLRDLVTKFETNTYPQEHAEFAKSLEKLTHNFDIKKLYGTPIAVSRHLEEPYVLVEGFTRCSALLMNKKNSTILPQSIPFIVGVGSNVEEWKYDDNPSDMSLF